MDQLPPVLETCGTGLNQFQSSCTPTSRNKKPVTVQLHLKIGGKLDWTGLCFTTHKPLLAPMHLSPVQHIRHESESLQPCSHSYSLPAVSIPEQLLIMLAVKEVEDTSQGSTTHDSFFILTVPSPDWPLAMSNIRNGKKIAFIPLPASSTQELYISSPHQELSQGSLTPVSTLAVSHPKQPVTPTAGRDQEMPTTSLCIPSDGELKLSSQRQNVIQRISTPFSPTKAGSLQSVTLMMTPIAIQEASSEAPAQSSPTRSH